MLISGARVLRSSYFDSTTIEENPQTTQELTPGNFGEERQKQRNNHLSLNKCNNMKICHINTRSVFNKRYLIELFCNNHVLDILCITETWLQELQVNTFKLNNFTMLTHFSRQNSSHGGTAIFVSNNFRLSILPVNYITNFAIENVMECCGVSIAKKTCLVSIYRPPCNISSINDIFFNQFNYLLDILSVKFENIIICGDLNIDQFCKNALYENLIDIFDSHNLHPIIKEATRIQKLPNKPSPIATAIDYFITNKIDIVKSTLNINPGLSDHYAQIVEIDINCTKPNKSCKITARKFSMNNIQKFRQHLVNHLHSITWSDNTDIDFNFDNFHKQFLWSFNLMFPLKTTVNHKKIKK